MRCESTIGVLIALQATFIAAVVVAVLVVSHLADEPEVDTAVAGIANDALETIPESVDPQMPESIDVPMQRFRWRWTPADGDRYNGLFGYDPLQVQDMDVQDGPGRAVIEEIRREWVLDGITCTRQRVVREDETGETIFVDEDVLEAWFAGKPHPYKVGDRLPNTLFTIGEIFPTRFYRSKDPEGFRVRAGVDLQGDTGAQLTLFVRG